MATTQEGAAQRALGIGVIGTGGMGTRHAENVHAYVKGAYLVGVMDVDRDRAGRIATAYGAQVFDDAHALIHAPQVDAVIIAAPDPVHAELTLACLDARKPVLCEKPLATNAADARRVVDAELALGRRMIQVGFMRHYDPAHLGVKEAVEKGQIGRPFLFKGVHRNAHVAPGFNMTSDFVVLSSLVHDLESARWLLGQEITEVFVRGVGTTPAFGPDVWDLQSVLARFDGGALASIEVYVSAEYGYEVTAEVVGERGVATTGDGDAPWIRREGACARPIGSDWLARFQTAYVAELQDWVAAIRNGTVTGPNAWDGYMTVLAAEACIRSIRSGRPESVQVPERPALYRD